MNNQAVVGVTAKHGSDDWIRENTHEYISVLKGYDVFPVVLSPDVPVVLPNKARFAPDDLGRLDHDIVAHLDGLVLAGGGDVDPKFFNAELDGANEAAIDLKRDELELNLARDAMAADIPIFGICRGCQVLNVAAGGGMVQDFPGHRSSDKQKVYHDVVVEPESRLRQIVDAERFQTNTYHHQGMDLKSMAPPFIAVAMAEVPDDWLVEAIESSQHRWLIGVQWHPERLHELGDEHRRLWDAFIDAVMHG